MAVGVAICLLETHLVPVLPVPPVLLAQPGLLPDPYLFRIETEGPEGLVGAAIRRDIGAHLFPAEEFPQPRPGRLRLPPAARGEPQGVVGFAFVHRVISVALRLPVPDENDALWSCHAKTVDRMAAD